MRRTGKAICAILLAAVILLGSLPVGVQAEKNENCKKGIHVPTDNIWQANYVPCDGGYRIWQQPTEGYKF